MSNPEESIPPDGITAERFAQVVAEAEAGYPALVAAFNRIDPGFQLSVPAPMPATRCDLCGETADAEMGEFYDPANPVAASTIAHAQCGIDAGLSLA